MIRVILAEDHDILREGLQSLFREEKEIKIVGEAPHGKALIDLLHLTPVDVILMDVNMPVMNGMEATAYIGKYFPQIKVLVLSMIDHKNYVHQMLLAGARGYVLKNASKEELILAIKKVHAGETYISHELETSPDIDKPEEKKYEDQIFFTKRELQILELIAEGLTNSEIADKIYLSKRTVESHRKSLLEKTNSKNSSVLIKYAICKGILKDVNID
jgi:DNA-binding NarL/FixJ family response regulator